MNREDRARMAVFEHLAALTSVHGEVLPRAELERGAPFEGERIRMIGPQGIFKPRQFSLPLSITTVPPVAGKEPPYPDRAEGDWLRYAYRGTDPLHRDNVGLRQAWQRRLPLVYFFGVMPGHYFACWPVLVIGDDPTSFVFTVALDASYAGTSLPDLASEDPAKGYADRSVPHRLHQRAFRLRVLEAYRRACAMCRLRHIELLDAAHIIRDSDDRSTTAVSNGLSLCKLHHAAFDAHIIGVRPDLVVEVRRDILDEIDGPMLRHGLQEMAGSTIAVPRSRTLRPDEESLLERYEQFRAAG